MQEHITDIKTKTYMNRKEIQAKRRVKYDTKYCIEVEWKIELISPRYFFEDGCLYVPDEIEMPDGKIITDFWFYDGLNAFLSNQPKPINLYVGRNFVSRVRDKTFKNWRLNISSLIFYDEVIDGLHTENGIIYDEDNNIVFAPQYNAYARELPLLLSNMRTFEFYDPYYGLNKKVLGIKDAFGGLYSPDGRKFIKWLGPDFQDFYSIREGVEVICNDAFHTSNDHFWNCRITKIQIPEGVKVIGDRAFFHGGLRSIDLPQSLRYIGEKAFSWIEGGSMPNKVKIPPFVTYIGKNCFNSTPIKRISIPASVSHIGKGCFGNCYELQAIDVDPRNTYYCSEDGVLYNKDKTTLIFVPPRAYNSNAEEAKKYIESIKSDHNRTVIKKVFAPFSGRIIFVDNNRFLLIEKNQHPRDFFVSSDDKALVADGQIIKKGSPLFISRQIEYSNSESNIMCFDSFPRKEYIMPETVTNAEPMSIGRGEYVLLQYNNTLKHISKEFYGNIVENFRLGRNVVNISLKEFQYTPIGNFEVSEENPTFVSVDGVLFNKDRTKLIHFPYQRHGEYTVPSSVKSISAYAFAHSQLDKLTVNYNVHYIGEFAFLYSKIKEVSLLTKFDYGNGLFAKWVGEKIEILHGGPAHYHGEKCYNMFGDQFGLHYEYNYEAEHKVIVL